MSENEQGLASASDPWGHLEGKRRKRLEKLCGIWLDEDPGSYWSEKLTLGDLRLLLEHPSPLRELIREISAVPETNPSPRVTENRDEDASAVRQELVREKEEKANLLQKLQETKEALREARKESERAQILERDLSQLQQKIARLEQKQAEIPTLAFLRRDSQLAESMGLSGLRGESNADLIRVVAVLSQMDNIRRLWDTLKARCERELRAASEEESVLLETALSWHNYNWLGKPYRLVSPQAGQDFDFNAQQRAVSTPAGDRIQAVWLPGMVASNGVMLQKALVTTN